MVFARLVRPGCPDTNTSSFSALPLAAPGQVMFALDRLVILVNAEERHVEVVSRVLEAQSLTQGASVRLLPVDKGTTTNQIGFFSIPNVAPGNYTLEVSFVGYEVHRQKLTVPEYGVVQLGKIVLKRSNASMEVLLK